MASMQEHGATKADVQVLDGNIGALNVKVEGLDAKIDRTREELEAKIDRTREELEAKIDRTREELEAKIDRLGERFEMRTASFEERFGTKEAILVLDGKLAALDVRVASIEKHGATKADLKALEARIGWWILGVSILLVVQLVLLILRR